MNSTVIPISSEVVHKTHSHFFGHVESFHGLEDQPDFQSQHKAIMDKLRHQYLNDNDWD